ncbi:MAG: FGGY family carbohydrate kinase [Bacteroidota bacterium]|nr:FGGY family carbohydrate kinase [Bacteroidota bacterium]
MNILGLDIGSSFVKASVIDAERGELISSASAPEQEMKMTAERPGWAEQEPEIWWQALVNAVRACLAENKSLKENIKTIGISYQMHGLVCVDSKLDVIRPSIIWCDSRAVTYGNTAYKKLGHKYCMGNLLNHPGNFTAAKLAWLKENEPGNFDKIYRIMLPGDYIAMRLTGEICTTITGLSEGVFWDFKENKISERILDCFGFEKDIFPMVVKVFSEQGQLCSDAADRLGLKKGIPVSYRAGDQPNNAFSLNVMSPGEVAATAGTSGVLYGVTDKVQTDEKSRVNLFAHVNHSIDKMRLGMLACINGTGIMNAWVRRLTGHTVGYDEMNRMAGTVTPGSEGLQVFPFGNGAERLLENVDIGASFRNLNLNVHTSAHLFRAVQEGIAYSFKYASEILGDSGIDISVIRAGKANMFLSEIFVQLIADLTGASVVLYNTDGAMGAARGAGLGAGIYRDEKDAFTGMDKVGEILPDSSGTDTYSTLYKEWKNSLLKELGEKNI